MSIELPPPAQVRVVLCDADGNLFPSEEPAFAASTQVTNQFLAEHGVPRRYQAEELRLAATGMSYRSVLTTLVRENGLPALSPEALEGWVKTERTAVTTHLKTALHPDPDVLGPLRALAEHHGVAAVSSSADPRIAACFEVTGMARYFPPERRFSAEDSLAIPTSKPDPAIYLYALAALGLRPDQAVAIEDSPTGATSAITANIPTIGNLQFVQPDERVERRAQLVAVGVTIVVTRWADIAALLR